VFQVRSDLNGIIVSQLVPVQPNATYDFECFLSTDKLETGSGPQVQIVDALSSKELGVSTAAPGGTSQQWKAVNFSFQTTDKTEAVMLKIIRVSCGTKEAPVCPIFGSIWYDDFSFKRRN
jgi:hypothetical protein